MEAIELGFDTLVRLCILLIELAGIIVIVISMVRGFIGFVQKDDGTRIQLGHHAGPGIQGGQRGAALRDRQRLE